MEKKKCVFHKEGYKNKNLHIYVDILHSFDNH